MEALSFSVNTDATKMRKNYDKKLSKKSNMDSYNDKHMLYIGPSKQSSYYENTSKCLLESTKKE